MEVKQQDRMTVADAQSRCLERNIPFFSYRLPGEKSVYFGAQRTPFVESFRGFKEMRGKEGFVLVPFWTQGNLPSLILYPDICFTDTTADEEKIVALSTVRWEPRVVKAGGRDSDYEAYRDQIGRMIRALGEGKLEKVVMARSLTIPIEGYKQVVEWFRHLTIHYPQAFVFLVSVPGVTVWAGATPEIFMQQTACGFRTMALAGTQALTGDPDHLFWGKKEQEEQQIVSDYIGRALERVRGNAFRTKGPFSAVAGNVAHLCTLFESENPLSAEEVDRLRKDLHPTPAVGGFPKEKALHLIEDVEICDRRYYAGYLGPVGKEGFFRLYVNLRSMELFPKSARLYVGGGVTALSDPDAEWKETELKSKTLLDWNKDGTKK